MVPNKLNKFIKLLQCLSINLLLMFRQRVSLKKAATVAKMSATN